MYVCMYVCVCLCVCMSVCVRVCVCVCVCVYIYYTYRHIHICTCIHIYIHTHMHACIHTHTNKQTRAIKANMIHTCPQKFSTLPYVAVLIEQLHIQKSKTHIYCIGEKISELRLHLIPFFLCQGTLIRAFMGLRGVVFI